jgi:hypothetical protein
MNLYDKKLRKNISLHHRVGKHSLNTPKLISLIILVITSLILLEKQGLWWFFSSFTLILFAIIYWIGRAQKREFLRVSGIRVSGILAISDKIIYAWQRREVKRFCTLKKIDIDKAIGVIERDIGSVKQKFLMPLMPALLASLMATIWVPAINKYLDTAKWHELLGFTGIALFVWMIIVQVNIFITEIEGTDLKYKQLLYKILLDLALDQEDKSC